MDPRPIRFVVRLQGSNLGVPKYITGIRWDDRGHSFRKINWSTDRQKACTLSRTLAETVVEELNRPRWRKHATMEPM